MWPFKRKPVELPEWNYVPLQAHSTKIVFANGEWQISDGGSLDQIIDLGSTQSCIGRIHLFRNKNGISKIQLNFDNLTSAKPWSNAEIVIDSGAIVIRQADNFLRANLNNRSSKEFRAFSKEILKTGRDHDAVQITNLEGKTVAICIYPPFGDGGYPVEFEQIENGNRINICLSDEH
ncbi:MAG: hypothetical protein KDA65_06955 [Planctomycetaceae bacterium]|nr:hypothetical protein [Planctomycetaceae bacterium]